MTILDKYVLSQTMRRLMIAVSIVLIILVLERVLRLFEFAAANNAQFGLVLQMAANLVPHYLGLALPAAFFISILLLMANLGENSELDVIFGSGMSVRRMARPIIVTGIILSIISVVLMGYVQPYSRYGYRAIKHAATHAVWSETIAAQTFFSPARGLTIYANGIDLERRRLTGVFIHQITSSGRESTISAASGRVETDPETGQSIVELENAVQIVERPDEPTVTLFLGNLIYTPDFPFEPAPFRARGEDHRELTLGELLTGELPEDALTDDDINRAKLSAEANGRLARSISVATMPLLAVPMGLAVKRRRRGAALTVAAVMLLVYHYTLELGQGLTGLGYVSPWIGLWIPFCVFTLICFTLFLRVDQKLRPSVFEMIFDRVDRLFDKVRHMFRRKRQPAA